MKRGWGGRLAEIEPGWGELRGPPGVNRLNMWVNCAILGVVTLGNSRAFRCLLC